MVARKLIDSNNISRSFPRQWLSRVISSGCLRIDWKERRTCRLASGCGPASPNQYLWQLEATHSRSQDWRFAWQMPRSGLHNMRAYLILTLRRKWRRLSTLVGRWRISPDGSSLGQRKKRHLPIAAAELRTGCRSIS